MTEDELEAFEAAMAEQGNALREALAEDLGGEPSDYGRYPVSEDSE